MLPNLVRLYQMTVLPKETYGHVRNDDAEEMLRRAEGHGQLITNLRDADTAILVDLLRRSGQPREALSVIAARRGGIAGDTLARMMDYEALLISRGGTACHALSEAAGHG